MSIIKKYISMVKVSIIETLKLLFRFKWYVLVYLIFYFILYLDYLMPSPKNYFLWDSWCVYDKQIYLAVTKLLLIIFALLFFVGTSNMRNHPRLAKFIFISPLLFGIINLVYAIIQDLFGSIY
ncbi:MAG: hypothetical protein IJW75_05685 [Alphaproteobacteria bacterium]|nr:hypothetical protein [Alphaproteobacteria bacterium]